MSKVGFDYLAPFIWFRLGQLVSGDCTFEPADLWSISGAAPACQVLVSTKHSLCGRVTTTRQHTLNHLHFSKKSFQPSIVTVGLAKICCDENER